MDGLKQIRHGLLAAALLIPAPAFAADELRYELFPDQSRQTVLGLGVEIQSDSIGSGNHGLPEAPIAVPHDLVPAERERFAREMLRGFRYLRLAGGLYWRGLDDKRQRLQPRWPEQLAELKSLVDTAGIEGLSFEYWSPAPFWKANRSYVGTGPKDPENVLRPFGANFAADPDYSGDRTRFFNDFADAVVADIQTLTAAGLKVSMFGLQNEPWVSNATYSANRYPTSADYIAAFGPVARAVRQHDPGITILADTGEGFPEFIGPGMTDPAIAPLVDAYAVHTIGRDSATVMDVDKHIRAELPPRPWFQNEYEYLTGGATPARTLNTVQHIINSFQDAGNPTWFWLHALKPVGNAEASGYALGFWNSAHTPAQSGVRTGARRWHNGPALDLPKDLARMELVYGRVGAPDQPGSSFHFLVDRPAEILLLVEERGGFAPTGWRDTGRKLVRGDAVDRVFARRVPAGRVDVPAHEGTADGRYGAPHAALVSAAGEGAPSVQVGVNTPAYVLSQVAEVEAITADVAPGHWTFNLLNWNAVGSFTRRMPWNSVVIGARSATESQDARLLVFRKPDGKRTVVVSNRKSTPVTFRINTNLTSAWRGYRYEPREAGPDTMGRPVGGAKGQEVTLVVPPMSWEFWEER